jgi:ubiquinone/menaquinone biosynthesis C-methylase UbiE
MAQRAKRERWRDPEVARVYDARRFGGRLGRLKHARDAHLVLALLGRAGGVKSVLDLPAGTGRLGPDLAAAGLCVTGADLSLEMLRAGGERAGGAARVQAEGEHLPFADGAFDAAVCVRFLFHVEEPETRRRILSELARVARLGVVGEVRWGATAKHAARRLRRHPHLRPAFGGAELARELAAAGLALEVLRPVSRLFSDKAFFLARRA